MYKESIHILRQAKKVLGILLLFAIVGEIIFFPSMPNLYGCLMAIISYVVFSNFLKEKYIRNYPFAFCMYLSMFMYRFLPLIATIAEGKPITFGFERPYETFMYEIILFLISSLAFYLACRKNTLYKNNLLKQTLYDLKFFETTPAILWSMGLIGLIIRLYNFGAGDVEYGDVGGKFLLGLDYLMYAPLCLIFPSLLNIKYSNKKILILYSLFIFILNIASNSRRQIIIPIGIVALMLLLFLVLNNLKITDYLSKTKLFILCIVFIFLINALSTISLAMLYTRKIRSDVDKKELFEQTISVIQNPELMENLKYLKETEGSKLISYEEGWTEYYVKNFMLARYANLRITDETLYYAEKKGYANRQMQELFKDNIIALLPNPILKFFGINFDKNKLEYSRADLLSGSSLGGYRVTSHVGDGLATFSYWYFPLQFIAFFIIFKLLNSLVFTIKGKNLYAPFAVMQFFTFLALFKNSNGITADISYIIRGYIQGIVTFLIVFHIVRMVLRSVNAKFISN
jgi:hypothetical protein